MQTTYFYAEAGRTFFSPGWDLIPKTALTASLDEGDAREIRKIQRSEGTV